MFRFDASRAVGTVFGVMMVSTAIVMAPAEAAAKHRKHVVHFHRAHASALMAQAAVPPAPAATIGPMRYYGGPKSPMWR